MGILLQRLEQNNLEVRVDILMEMETILLFQVLQILILVPEISQYLSGIYLPCQQFRQTIILRIYPEKLVVIHHM